MRHPLGGLDDVGSRFYPDTQQSGVAAVHTAGDGIPGGVWEKCRTCAARRGKSGKDASDVALSIQNDRGLPEVLDETMSVLGNANIFDIFKNGVGNGFPDTCPISA